MVENSTRRLDAVGGSGRGVYWCVVVLCVALSAWLAVAATGMLTRPERPGAWGPLVSAAALLGGLTWLVVTATFYRNYLHVPQPDARKVTVEVVGGLDSVVVTWRTTFHRQPLFVSVVVVVAAACTAVALLRLGEAWWWLPLVVVTPLLLALPDRMIELTRPLRLVLNPLGIGVSGLAGDAWLDWADIRQIEIEHDNQWAVVRLVGVKQPESWHVERRPRFLHASVPERPQLDIPGPAFPVDVQTVVDALEHYSRTPAARAELAGEAGRRRLLGEAAS
jgi:hypothetical protein